MCWRLPPRSHASISVGNFVHESWNKQAGFRRHVGRVSCAMCESVRPHGGCHPVVSGCHSEACGGTSMRPHATLRPRLTSNTSHTPPPSPSRFHLLTRGAITGTTHSHFKPLEEKARGEGDGGGGTIDGVRGRRWCSPERSGFAGTRAG